MPTTPLPLHPDTADRRGGASSGENTGGENTGGENTGRVVIITGMSGAGKTSALKVFEDLGFEAVDNPPLRLLGGLMSNESESASRRPLAIGVDIRTRDFEVGLLLARIKALRSQRHLMIEVLFLDADDETLANRFTETRRRHPIGGDLPVPDGIAIERTLLRTLREQADLVIETSRMGRTAFRELLEKTYATAASLGMTLFVTSFGFRNGLPRNADLVFDVRFLRNPYYDPALRPLTGRDRRVSDYVMADQGFEDFYGNLTRLLEPLLPRYEEEGKRYLTIAIGCTGGRHRSVATAERLGGWLAQTGRHVLIRHRDAPPPEPKEQSEGTAQ